MPTDLAEQAITQVPKPKLFSANTLLRVGGLSVIGFVVLAMVFTQGADQSRPQASTYSLESRLLSANLTQLNIDRSSNNIVLSGYVPTHEKAIQLAEFVENQPETLINKVLVDEEIKNQIENVLLGFLDL